MSFNAVRLRPAFYVGDISDGTGLDSLVYELAANAINQALAQQCDTVEIILCADGSVTVRDNGPGLPVEQQKDGHSSAAEHLLTIGHVGDTPRSLYGTHVANGIGLAVVNALSAELYLHIRQGGLEYAMEFREGIRQSPLAVIGAAGLRNGEPLHGTEIRFKPSPKIFPQTGYDFARLKTRLASLAAYRSGASITLVDERDGQQVRLSC